jgi:hypothetical protein
MNEAPLKVPECMDGIIVLFKVINNRGQGEG